MPIFNQTLFDLIIGSTMSPAAITALGADYAHYVSDFNTYSEALEPPPAVASPDDQFIGRYDYYDRAHIYYVWYKMGGYTNATHLSRANAVAARYRTYVLSHPEGVNGYLQFVRGLALHYAATGEVASLEAIRIIADFNGYFIYPIYVVSPKAPNVGSSDERTWARAHESYLIAAACGITSTNGFNWNTLAAGSLEALLNAQYADGAWRSAAQSQVTYPNQPWGVRPFYCGMITEALILDYTLRSSDARIVTALQAVGEYLFTGSPYNLWQPGPNVSGGYTWYNSFKYLEFSTFDEANQSDLGAPDLNGDMINIYAFVYAHTGTLLWKTRAELILNGMRYANTYLDKQFNETYTYSYKTFPLLNATVIENNVLAVGDAADTMNIIGRVGTSIRLNWV